MQKSNDQLLTHRNVRRGADKVIFEVPTCSSGHIVAWTTTPILIVCASVKHSPMETGKAAVKAKLVIGTYNLGRTKSKNKEQNQQKCIQVSGLVILCGWSGSRQNCRGRGCPLV